MDVKCPNIGLANYNSDQKCLFTLYFTDAGSSNVALRTAVGTAHISAMPEQTTLVRVWLWYMYTPHSMPSELYFMVQIQLGTEVLCTPSSTRLGFELMTSRS